MTKLSRVPIGRVRVLFRISKFLARALTKVVTSRSAGLYLLSFRCYRRRMGLTVEQATKVAQRIWLRAAHLPDRALGPRGHLAANIYFRLTVIAPGHNATSYPT